MKLILLLILALVIASGLAYQVHLEPGYALLTYGHVSIETSLAVLLFVTLIIFIGFYFSLRALLTLKRSPKSISRWNQKRKTTRSQKEINKGLINSAEGNWQRSEKLLVKHAEQSDTPLLNYLSAAHAAQSQGAYNRRDEYLFKAGKTLPDQIHAIQLTRAKLQLAAGQFEQALATLRQPKPFGSVLGEVMAEHVAMMRRRGYKYTSQPVRLLQFDRFLQLNPQLETEPLRVMIDRWAATKGTRNHAYERENLERLFAKIQRRCDP